MLVLVYSISIHTKTSESEYAAKTTTIYNICLEYISVLFFVALSL